MSHGGGGIRHSSALMTGISPGTALREIEHSGATPAGTIPSAEGDAVSGNLEDWIDEDNPVRAIDAFVDKLDLSELGFDGVAPEATGRPSYHPSGLLKLYIYGYLNRVQSSRRLERALLGYLNNLFGELLGMCWITPSGRRFVG